MTEHIPVDVNIVCKVNVDASCAGMCPTIEAKSIGYGTNAARTYIEYVSVRPNTLLQVHVQTHCDGYINRFIGGITCPATMSCTIGEELGGAEI